MCSLIRFAVFCVAVYYSVGAVVFVAAVLAGIFFGVTAHGR